MGVLIYTTPTCSFCRQAKEYLRSKQVPFTEKNVAVDSQAAQEMVQRSGQRGVPVLVIGGELIVGFDRPRIDRALERMGSGKARLGASIADAATMTAKVGLDIKQGAYVGRVNTGTPAERAGLMAGDVILGLAGSTIAGADDVQRVVEALSPGQRVSATIWREGRRIQLEVPF